MSPENNFQGGRFVGLDLSFWVSNVLGDPDCKYIALIYIENSRGIKL